MRKNTIETILKEYNVQLDDASRSFQVSRDELRELRLALIRFTLMNLDCNFGEYTLYRWGPGRVYVQENRKGYRRQNDVHR